MILTLIVDRFEGEVAVLKTNDGDTILWPKNRLPADIKEGSALTMAITGERGQEADSRQLAKDILNEILNPEEQTK